MKEKNIHDKSAIGIVIATTLTILPLAGIYLTPNIWWGILLKVFFIIIILGTLQNYWFHPLYTNVQKHGFGAGIILNMLWFSCFYFFSPHWITYFFSLLFLITLLTMKRILKKYYSVEE